MVGLDATKPLSYVHVKYNSTAPSPRQVLRTQFRSSSAENAFLLA
jgi:hypothetical protein